MIFPFCKSAADKDLIKKIPGVDQYYFLETIEEQEEFLVNTIGSRSFYDIDLEKMPRLWKMVLKKGTIISKPSYDSLSNDKKDDYIAVIEHPTVLSSCRVGDWHDLFHL